MAKLQLNLLPDVKLEFVKAQRMKRLMIFVSITSSISALVILGFMVIAVDVVQKKNLRDIASDIKTNSAKLTSSKDINKILTVQNQLGTLTSLHDQKVVASRLFTYLAETTPQTISLSSLDIDYTANTMVISGQAPSLDAVNTYTDTLKSTKYTTSHAAINKPSAFSAVVLSSFGRSLQGATFTISFTFDPIIFNSANNVTLTVPSGVQTNTTKLFQQVQK